MKTQSDKTGNAAVSHACMRPACKHRSTLHAVDSGGYPSDMDNGPWASGISLKAWKNPRLPEWIGSHKILANGRQSVVESPSFSSFGTSNMVVIRLARGGAHKRPFYNMVVADSRCAAGGKFIERVGFYDPKAPEGRENLRVAMDRLTFWRGKGAQLSPTVARLVKQFGKKVAGTVAPAA